MNNTVLTTALLTILSTAAYADNSVQLPTPLNAAKPMATAPGTIQPSLQSAPQPAAVVNCKYHIPAEKNNIEQPLITSWAGKAAVQSFTFNPTTIDDELIELKPCYTDQGWQGFSDALQKSGNIEAIKAQHLTVSSQVDGEVKINTAKDNQWKVTVPIQAVYQNYKEKLTQLLTIDLLIGRKISGDIGIMQMIATPRQQPGAPGTANASEQPPQEPIPANVQTPTPGSNQPMQAAHPQ